ncbi:ThuA domain-containing protein [Pleomorphovibrio marinus]|uniref:ThuA domain-containing protein n=1 Tax=Pleomorphovibrio marinus TaxID=2164132 RepID=UPI001E3B3A62|nr:ThuA domain-containing protein [Pleomorphovibrio marinus]
MKFPFLSHSRHLSMPFILTFLFALGISYCQAQHGEKWLEFKGEDGPGKGKKIVLISGDDEYRSEEGLPMLGKILAKHHGFDCTVLFPIDPSTNEVVPNYQKNIPGLSHLETADLVIMLIRFRELPDEQMKHIDDYVQAGKPIIGLRTSTHAFNFGKESKSSYSHYHWQSNKPGWEKGFGRRILGETWVAHHGNHGVEGTRALLDGLAYEDKHPILKGIKDIWVPSDVYTIKEIGDDATVLVHGIPTEGMQADTPLVWEKALMPIAWHKTYTSDNGNQGKVFASTMGSSVDLESEDLRKLVVNAAYWCLDMEDEITESTKVDIVGDFQPTMFGFDNFRKGMKVSDFK